MAIDAMCQIEQKSLNERLALSRSTRRLGIRSPSARGLAHKLLLETIRNQNLLDHIINTVLKPDYIGDLQPSLRAFLRLYTSEVKIKGNGSYEKASNIAKTGRSIIGWRRFREIEETLGFLLGLKMNKILRGLSDTETVSLRMSQPLWFVKYCFHLLGRHETLQFFSSLLTSTPTYIRINTSKMSTPELLKTIRRDRITLQKTKDLLHTYKVVDHTQPLPRTPSFKEGLFYIQDKASCLASEVAAPEAGMTVLDICAAPGAKTSHLAQLMDNRGEIFSIDYSRRRMRIWKGEMERLNVKNAAPLVSDLFHSPPLHDLEADLIMLDPPCTSTGVFSRAPSAKWRLSKKSIRRSAVIQWKMINNCVEPLKKGGFLVYSTCSITVEENEILIERFLKWHPEFRLVETKPRIGLPGLRGQTLSQRLFPHIHECNGFFVAKLEKEI